MSATPRALRIRRPSRRSSLPSRLWVLIAARCVNRLGGFSMAFLGVLLVRELGAGPGETALALTCFGVATIPSRILGGHLADGWGHRSTMVLGLVGCAVAQLVVAAAPTVTWVLVGAILLGLAYEIVEPPTQALVSNLVPAPDRAFAYSALNASLAVAGVLAGLVAAAVSGFGLRWLFVVDAVTCLAAALLVATRIPAGTAGADATRRAGHSPAHPDPSPRLVGNPPAAAGSSRARWVGALTDPRLRPVVAFGTVVATVTMLVVLGVPLLVEQRGLAPATTGWILAAGAAASVPGAWVAAALRRRVDERGVLLVGEVTAAAGLGTIALAPHPVGLTAGLVAFDIGSLLVIATTMARAGTLAPDHARGTYLAVLGLTWGLATSVAPVVLTTLGTAYGPGAPFGAAALVLLASAVLRARHGRPRLDPTLT
ncbi:MFS transporter [Terrabacter carboxydivorans]|uniref:Major facilitator superfamily (MFS) profile domain-containing protein n=1 Tax=Terrabacter carboxydivorans TaxID=619730 RepID=A0ABP5XYL5_9MICO